MYRTVNVTLFVSKAEQGSTFTDAHMLFVTRSVRDLVREKKARQLTKVCHVENDQVD